VLIVTTPSAMEGQMNRLREQTCPLTIVPNDFYEITPMSSKNKKFAAIGIALQKSEAPNAFPHVRIAGRQPNVHAG
jgi:hypothetical protein